VFVQKWRQEHQPCCRGHLCIGSSASLQSMRI
jgi:hypothetical protein